MSNELEILFVKVRHRDIEGDFVFECLDADESIVAAVVVNYVQAETLARGILKILDIELRRSW